MKHDITKNAPEVAKTLAELGFTFDRHVPHGWGWSNDQGVFIAQLSCDDEPLQLGPEDYRDGFNVTFVFADEVTSMPVGLVEAYLAKYLSEDVRDSMQARFGAGLMV